MQSYAAEGLWREVRYRMVTPDAVSGTAPAFSIIVAVYNDWEPLGECLQSLGRQEDAPGFEVIIVDDGSREPAPEFIRQWGDHYPLAILHQPHRGIPASRNRGVQSANGSVLLFVDADCRLRTDCLAKLAATVVQSPQHNSFQLRLTGDRSSLVGKTEELRFITLEKQLIEPDGCIRYLNTSAFAIRRARVDREKGFFDVRVLRGEDTLLLAHLIAAGELPFFVANAIVQHVVLLSLGPCLLKDIRSAYLERRAYDIISAKGVRMRVDNRQRLAMLLSMWKTAGQRGIGRLAWFVLVGRQSLQRIVSLACWLLRLRPAPPVAETT
ncbi:MAG TPA: glycosyltransferase family A protein [Terriglobales bacterium]|nr:glycosyltransferase family A protein [Terriglobales bacterium]